MSDRAGALICALLLAALVAQTALLFGGARREGVVPVVLTYRLESAAAPLPPPRPPRADGSRSSFAAVMTTDDIIRGLHGLLDDPSSPGLSAAQRRRLAPLVAEAAERKARLHRLRGDEEAQQQMLAEDGTAVVEVMSPRQRAELPSDGGDTEALRRDLPGLGGR